MVREEIITLDCPYCQAAITQALSCFKRTYATCPHCGGGLAADQFATQLTAIDQAFDAAVEEMVHGVPISGGCCREKK